MYFGNNDSNICFLFSIYFLLVIVLVIWYISFNIYNKCYCFYIIDEKLRFRRLGIKFKVLQLGTGRWGFEIRLVRFLRLVFFYRQYIIVGRYVGEVLKISDIVVSEREDERFYVGKLLRVVSSEDEDIMEFRLGGVLELLLRIIIRYRYSRSSVSLGVLRWRFFVFFVIQFKCFVVFSKRIQIYGFYGF